MAGGPWRLGHKELVLAGWDHQTLLTDGSTLGVDPWFGDIVAPCRVIGSPKEVSDCCKNMKVQDRCHVAFGVDRMLVCVSLKEVTSLLAGIIIVLFHGDYFSWQRTCRSLEKDAVENGVSCPS